MQRNVAGQTWLAFAFNRSTGAPVTGDASNITGQLCKDGGSLTALDTPNPTEIGLGYYRFALTQAETNAAMLDLVVQSSTSNVAALAVEATKQTVPNRFSLLGIDADGEVAAQADEIAAQVAISLRSITLTLQQQLTVEGATNLYVIQGDDYTRAPVRIDLNTESLDDPDMDLSTYKLIIAANTQSSTTKIIVRMDILGDPGEHYVVFNPPSTLTETWPTGVFNLLYRLEWDENEYQTLDSGGVLQVDPFDIEDEDIVDLAPPA